MQTAWVGMKGQTMGRYGTEDGSGGVKLVATVMGLRCGWGVQGC